MHIEMVDAVNDPEDCEAPLTYTVDGVRKQIPWSALYQLFEERQTEQDQHHSEEEKLLAQIVSENWIDSDDWWEGASAKSVPSL
jgi:hypothetical protein